MVNQPRAGRLSTARLLILAGLLVLGGVVTWAFAAGALQPAGAAGVCPAPGDGRQFLQDPEGGYCLLYPDGYSPVQPGPGATELVAGSVLNHTDPRLSIEVTDAAGQSLDDVAARFEAEYVPAGWDVERQAITVDGVKGVVLDNLPGQDLNRRVVLVRDGRAYALFLAPLGDEGSETREQAERLYRQVLDSFRFVNAG